ncbi:CPBP family intramembrane metalloprotease [bacterium CPR1]|nr:CPBP family intramembrane metalloprotease [bacterium CPR1]
MKRIGAFLGLLAVGWVAAWLIPGLILGQPTILLSRHGPREWKDGYLIALYCWLLFSTSFSWRRWGPQPGSATLALRPGWVRLFTAGLLLGIGMIVGSRLILTLFGRWTPPPDPQLLAALVAAPLMAIAEEVVFRGYLFQVAREEWGKPAAYLGVNLFFAVLHLFRPGTTEWKLAFGVSLVLAGIFLSLLVERTGSLWMAIGVHTTWVFIQIVDPPGRLDSSWFWGLSGDPLSGILGWILLALTCGPFLGPARARQPSPEGP